MRRTVRLVDRLSDSSIPPALVALALGLLRLGHASLWADEGETYGAAIHRLQPYEHPVTYFWFMRLWMAAFGTSEIALRLPSVIAVAGLVVVLHRMGRLIPLPRIGSWAAWLAALSPFVRLGAQEARMYAPLAFTQTVAVWGLLSSLRGNRRGPFVWAAGAAASAALHHLGWLACWPPWIVALALSRNRRPLVTAGLVAVGLYAPLAFPTARQVLFRVQGGHLGSTPSLLAALKKAVGHVYYMGAGYLFTRLDTQALRGIVRSPLLVVFLLQLTLPAVLAATGLARAWRLWRRDLWILAAFFAPTFLFLVYEGSPANLLLPVFASWAFALAAGLLASPRPAAAVLLILWVPALVRQSTTSGYLLHPEDWRGMAATIRSESSAKDAVFLTGSRNSLFMADYYSFDPAVRSALVDSVRAFGRFDPHLPEHGLSVVAAVDSVLGRHDRVWFVYIDWDVPLMEESVARLWAGYGRWRARFGDGLELLRLERSGS